MTTQLFENHTLEENTQALANFMPGGRAFESKNIDDSNFRDLLSAFAPEMKRFEDTYLEVSKEHGINNADVYLSRWEKAVGIPDDCFLGIGSISDRRQHVIIKLACMNVSTREDFINIATKLGFTVEIESLSEACEFPATFPFPLCGSDKENRFTLVIGIEGGPSLDGFPFTFPFEFGDQASTILECIYDKVKPANVKLILLST